MRDVLIFVHDLYEELELWYPKLRLEEAGFRPIIAGPDANTIYAGKHGYPCKSDVSFQDIDSSDFSAVVIPGGFAPDKLRRSAQVLNIVRSVHSVGKPIAFICHGGWVPISAKILKGRRVTGVVAIRDDLENAGAHYLDEAVVVDGNLVSSRVPSDLPAFCQALLSILK